MEQWASISLVSEKRATSWSEGKRENAFNVKDKRGSVETSTGHVVHLYQVTHNIAAL